MRTPNFKQWFGDWEVAAGVQKIAAATAINLDGVNALADKKAIEDVFRKFSPVENHNDGRIVTFPVSMADKIGRHRGFDVKRIAGAFDRLFASAVPMISEVEQARAEHKPHPEIAAYHHYVSKFEQDGKTYYVRFTVQQMRAKPGRTGPSIAHSSFVSEVSVYEQGAAPDSAGVRVIDPVLTESAAPIDEKIALWLDDGNHDTVSKVTDQDTGEPLVVYHGTDVEFNEIDFAKGLPEVFWFTSDKKSIEAGEVGAAGKGVIMEMFAKIHNPADWDQYDKLMIDQFGSNNLDGAILSEGDGVFTGFVSNKSNQIKSATGNDGNIGLGNANVYHQSSVTALSGNELGNGLSPDKVVERAYGRQEAYDRAKAAGKTKLNYRQWVQIRTPNFKQWFGDWELVNAKRVLNDDPVASIRRGVISAAPGEKPSEAAYRWLEEHPQKPFYRADVGEIVFNRNGLKNSLQHKFGWQKLNAVAAIPEVLSGGVVIDRSTDFSGKPIMNTQIAAPIAIDGVRYQMVARLRRDTSAKNDAQNKPNRFYLHEVVLEEEAATPIKTGVSSGNSEAGLTGGSGHIDRLLRSVFEFKSDSVSKVTDPETGEPLVVYHGGTVGTVFSHDHSGSGGGKESAFMKAVAQGLMDIKKARFIALHPSISERYLARSTLRIIPTLCRISTDSRGN